MGRQQRPADTFFRWTLLPVQAVAFSPDGAHLVSAGGTTLKLCRRSRRQGEGRGSQARSRQAARTAAAYPASPSPRTWQMTTRRSISSRRGTACRPGRRLRPCRVAHQWPPVGVLEKAAAAAGLPVTLKQATALDPGENVIELTAYNSLDLVASVLARAKITWTGTQPTVPRRLHVLVVGGGLHDGVSCSWRTRQDSNLHHPT